MPSERLQRQIDSLLDAAEAAVAERDWNTVRECCNAVLRVDPENEDATLFLQMAGDDSVTSTDAPTNGSEAPVEASTPNAPTPETPAPEPAAVVPQPPASEPAPEPEPQEFAAGRYEVKRYLGEGGKKKVYLAYDRTLDRDVAFALIKTDGLDDVGRERIKREAQAMGRMGTHPCVMPIYDLGEENGQPFMVQPLMSGGDVEGLVEDAEGPLDLEQAIQIGRQTAEGLAFAHSKGIVHRDIKPGNVWMDETGAAKVGDFGLAVATDRSRLTVEKVMVGTVSYMPPEQATGGDVTPKADLYSLGAMLYEMCAGRPPFLGDDEIAIITQHVNTPPVAPSWHNKAIPQSLDSLIMRLLAKAPTDRPESAEDVITALDEVDLSAAAAQTEDADPINRVQSGVFVGRRSTMDQLKKAFEEVMSGQGRMVTLVGEPGIGKTRTSQELQTYAAMRGAEVLWGRCHEGGGAPPYWPWVQALRTYVLAKDPEVLRTLLGANASVVSEMVPDIKTKLPEAQIASNIEDPEAARFRLFDSVANFLRTASLADPMVIILDDLHWADRSSLLLLEYVVKELRNSRLLLIGNYRDVEITRRHPLAIALGDLTREQLFERIHLEGLKQHEVRRFIEESAGVDAPDRLVDTVYAQTEGNPLFVTETVNLLVQEGDLTSKPVDRRTQSYEISVPDSVREVIGRRLDKLSEECYDVLTHAGVIGRQFRLQVLSNLNEELTEDQLVDLLDEALEARIIEEMPAEVGLYQFTDPMMQDALTEELSLTRRVRYHARIAQSLEAFWGANADEHAAELAHHYGLAEAVLGNDRLKHYLTLAGKRAIDSFAYESAEAHYRALLDALEPGKDDALKVDALLGLGRALSALARIEEAANATEQAFELLARSGENEKAVSVALSLFPMGGFETKIYEAASRLVTPDSPQAVDLMSRHARSLMSSDIDLASKRIAEAIEKAEELGETQLIMSCVASAASIDGMAGRWEPTLANSLRAIELGKEAGDAETEWLGHVWAANSYAATGSPAKSDEHNRQAVRVSEAAKNRGWMVSAIGGDARTEAFRGNWDAALAHIDKGLKLDYEDTRLFAVQARVKMETGDFAAVEDVYEDPRERHLHVWSACLYAFAALATGDSGYVEKARARFDTAFPSGIDKINSWSAANHAWALLPVIESDQQSAAARCEQFSDWSDRITHQLLSGDRLLGLLAWTAGDSEAASAHFEKAIEFCREADYRPQLAWSSVNYAEMLIDKASTNGASDLRDRIEKLQDEAVAIATDLRMKPVIERVLSARDLLKA